MSFQILQRAYAPYGTAAQFPASGDPRLIYRATDTGYLYTWDDSESAYKLAGIDPTTVQSDISTLQTDVSAVEGDISTLQGNVVTLTQGIVDAVSTHNTAPDAHADIRTLIDGRALSAHQHARADMPWVTDSGAALLTAASASAQRTALGMTAWAVAPWTDGTTSDIPEGTQLYFTDARADARIAAQKGQAEGIMPLDSGGKAPLAHMPDALIGQVKFKGVWDAATDSPVLPSATTSMGHYYVTSVAGSYGGIDYGVGDWCISDGTAWGKVDNSDAITSFAGRVGAILPIASDYSAHYLGLHAKADDAAMLGGQLPSYYAQAGHTHTFAGLTSKPTTLAGYGITDAAAASHTHSGYETVIGNPSANGYLLSSTSEGVRSWVAPYSHPATHAQSVIESSAGWITTELAGKQAAGSYLTTTGTAADSAKLGGVAASGYSQTSHTHNYAGSSSPGGAATSAATATTLATARAINGALFDGSADITISRLNDTSFKRITSPNGAVLTNYTPVTGSLCVRLPKGYSDTNIRFKLRVFSFLTGKSFDVTIAGYTWTGMNWLVPTAYITGNPQQDLNLTVRFGYDNATNRVEVYVGDLTQSWPETNAYVTEVQCGYAALDSGWVQGWDIFFESAAFRNVTATVTDCQVGYRPANAFTGAKVIGGTALNFVNGLLVS